MTKTRFFREKNLTIWRPFWRFFSPNALPARSLRAVKSMFHSMAASIANRIKKIHKIRKILKKCYFSELLGSHSAPKSGPILPHPPRSPAADQVRCRCVRSGSFRRINQDLCSFIGDFQWFKNIQHISMILIKISSEAFLRSVADGLMGYSCDHFRELG